MNRSLSILIIIVILFNGLLSVHAEAKGTNQAEEESRIGHLLDLYMTESFVMLRDESLHEKVQVVVSRIINATEKPDDSLRLRIINDQLPIASSFPGYIYVSTGMLDLLKNESELAYIIAHAIAHTINEDQNNSYNYALRAKQREKLTGQIMPLIFFSGVAGAAILGAGAATTVASASTLEAALLAESGIYTTAAITGALTYSDDLERVNTHNLFIPYINLPDTKQSLSVMVFLNDVYTGYGEAAEIRADNMAIRYTAKAGYDANVIAPFLEKTRGLRNSYFKSGNISHLLLANPGLEKRISNAEYVLENN